MGVVAKNIAMYFEGVNFRRFGSFGGLKVSLPKVYAKFHRHRLVLSKIYQFLFIPTVTVTVNGLPLVTITLSFLAAYCFCLLKHLLIDTLPETFGKKT